MPKIEFDSSTDYFANPALSQSSIKGLLVGMGTYNTVDPDAEEKTHFIHGSAVDCLLLTPSLFDRQYYVSELVEKPSDAIMTIVRNAYDNKVDNDIAENRNAIWNSCNLKQYFMNRAKSLDEDTRIDSVIKSGKDYWDELIIANGRSILDSNELHVINTIVNTFKSHDHTREYFIDSPNRVLLSQYPIYFKYKGLDCKALLDLVIVDTSAKTIQIIDVKTMGESTKAFPLNSRRRRYDIQAAWYTLAVEIANVINLNSITQIDLSDYRILPFKFIVDSTSSPGICPLVYTCTEGDMMIGRFGAKTRSVLYKIEEKSKVPIKIIYGFEKGIELYKWHELNSQWNYDRYIAESNGNLPLETWGF